MNAFLKKAFPFFFSLILFLIKHQVVEAQEYLRLNEECNLRFEKAFYDKNIHSAIRPFLLSDSINFDLVDWGGEIEAKSRFFSNDNMLSIKSGATSFFINPILTINPAYEIKSKTYYPDYQFGLALGGEFWKKITYRLNAFYGTKSFPDETKEWIDSLKIIPRFGKFLNKNGNNYNYLGLNGYLSYQPWKFLNLQTGIDKNFWGEGYRSLFLSDNSASYPFLKATVDVWKFKYIWLFGALRDYDVNYPNDEFRNKFLFSHFLSWNATKWLNLNFFESVVSNPIDSLGVTNFNLNYLNPVIFFRPVEFASGTADNALLGFGAKLKLWKKYQFYGQLVIDEFVFSEMTSGEDWWGNKYGIQAGLKVFDLFSVDNLFARIEINQVRPYTYSYSNNIINYGSFYQPMAHPSGANFQELLFQLHYHKKRFSLEFKAISSKAGLDIDSVSYGQDIYKSYELRQNDYGNSFLQGFSATYTNILLKTSWIMNPKNYFQLNFAINYKKKYLPNTNTDKFFISLGISTLLNNNDLDFL